MEKINLYDDPSFSVGFIGERKVYKGEYILFQRKKWYLSELTKLSDTDYMLPEDRLWEVK